MAKQLDSSNRFDTVPACNRRTDGRTVTTTAYHDASKTSRGKDHTPRCSLLLEADKRSKNFDERPHRRGSFSYGELEVTPASRGGGCSAIAGGTLFTGGKFNMILYVSSLKDGRRQPC